MAISLSSVLIKHKRRIRLVFSNDLAAAAYTTLSYYAITSLDAVGVSPTVIGAVAVSGSGHELELALGSDLAPGGKYNISAIGVPATDTSVTDNTSQKVTVFGQIQSPINSESDAVNTLALIYGRDLVWNGLDFAETPNGDLATISGSDNFISALSRRLLANGLPWDPSYGPNARAFVNGTAPHVKTLRGELLSQCGRDDRVKRATVTLEEDSLGRPVFVVNVTGRGGESAREINVTIPTSA